jgi:hypothetical protein
VRDGWEDEERPDPAPPGQYQPPAASKNTSQNPAEAGEPSYAQPTRTSTRKKQPGDIDRRIAAGEGTADGKPAGKGEEEDGSCGGAC